MERGESGGHGRYNRTSLNRHDRHEKRETWDYRKPPRRTTSDRPRIIHYEWLGHKWVRQGDTMRGSGQ